MALETATYISQLVATNPPGTDPLAQSDDHLRLIKGVLQAQFPNLGAAAVTGTAAQINAAISSGGLSTVSSSVTSLSITIASKSLTVETGKGFAAGQAVQLTYDLTNYMTGNITSYNSTTGALVVSVTAVVGSGTYAAWAVFVITQAPPFSDDSALIKNAADTTKVARFDASGITTATTRTYTLPDLSGAMGLSGGDNCITLYAGNGHGSTNTKIRRWTTTLTNVGTALTLTQSAANGDSITVVDTGMYEISYRDSSSAGICFYGISRNSAQLTTSIESLTPGLTSLGITNTNAANYSIQLTRVEKLIAGDVIRAHTDGTCNSTTFATSFFSIRKVGT